MTVSLMRRLSGLTLIRSVEMQITNNPIPSSGMFATPKNQEDLFAYLQKFSGSERALAMTVAMMTMNLCKQMVDEAVADQPQTKEFIK